MSINNSIYDYTTATASDVNYTLTIKPQRVLTEIASKNQEVHFADDGATEEVIALSSDTSFVSILEWDQISDANAGSLWDYWNDSNKANGYMNSFKWEHPLDGHTYVVKFDSNIERLLYATPTRGIAQVRLRIKGRI